MLTRTEAGSIILISFSGDYPAGSAGNEVAREMEAVVTNAVAEFAPVAVVFDLSELDYTWGDAIAGIFWALRRDSGDFLPSCVVAKEETGKALVDLVTQSQLSGVFKTDFSHEISQAMEHLAKRGFVLR
jgi:hypothetical protein